MSGSQTDDKRRSDILTLLGLSRADAAQGMSWAAVDNFVRQSKDMLYAQRWHREQVNAKLKQRYKHCGDEGIYEPPEYLDEGDDDMATGSFFNNTIISDRAASILTDALKGDIDQSQQVTPPARPPAAPWWRTFLATLLAVLLGAILIFLAYNLFGKQDRYEIIAEPFEPPELLEFIE